MHFYAFEFGFLKYLETLLDYAVRGYLSYAHSRARALELAIACSRNFWLLLQWNNKDFYL